MENAQILGTGSYLPSKVLTNKNLEDMVETSDDWIQSRTGIKERRIVENGITSSMLGTEAGKIAIKNSGIDADKIDLIIVATSTPDMFFPSTACLIQGNLKISGGFAFDISAACSGFVYALSVAENFVKTGACRNVLVVGAEVMSNIVDWTDRNTCIIFGDGAGAVVLGKGEKGIISSSLFADGRFNDLIEVPGGGSRYPYSPETMDKGLNFIKMKGNETFKVAVKCMVESIKLTLDKSGVALSDISLMVPHQANQRIVNAVAEKLGLPKEKLMLNMARYGNTSAASIPIALDEAVCAGRVLKGDIVLLCAFGSGLTWGTSLIQW